GATCKAHSVKLPQPRVSHGPNGDSGGWAVLVCQAAADLLRFVGRFSQLRSWRIASRAAQSSLTSSINFLGSVSFFSSAAISRHDRRGLPKIHIIGFTETTDRES